MRTVSTPDGKGFLLETRPETAQTPEQWCVYVPESTRERQGYDYWYAAKDCELIEREPEHERTDYSASIAYGGVRIVRSAEYAEREEAWMREHSTSATRARNERRVKAYRKAAMTPSKLRADKLIGEHIVIHGEHLVVAAKLHGGCYAVENHTRGCVSSERATWIRGAIKTRDAVRAMDAAA